MRMTRLVLRLIVLSKTANTGERCPIRDLRSTLSRHGLNADYPPGLAASTATAGMTAPEESFTTPAMVPI